MIANGVNGNYDSDEMLEVNKNLVEEEPGPRQVGSDVEEMEVESDAEAKEDDEIAEESVGDVERDKEDEVAEDEVMEYQNNGSDVECIDGGQSDCEDVYSDHKSGDEEEPKPDDSVRFGVGVVFKFM